MRGTAHHIAEKYVTLARDAQSSGDIVLAENYLQHAEHYYRLIAAAQAAMQQPINIVRSDLPQDDEEESDDLDTSAGDRAPSAPVVFEQPQPYVEDPSTQDQPDLPPRGERPQQARFDRRGPPPQNGNGGNPYRRNERGDRPRFDRPEGERPYRDDRGEPMGERGPDRGLDRGPERMPRDDRGERRFRDRFDRGDRMPREERGEGYEGGERAAAPDMGDRPERPDRLERAERPERSADRGFERGGERAERPERLDRPRRPERYRSRNDGPRGDAGDGDQPSLDALPAFITGGAPRAAEPARPVEPVRDEPPARAEAPARAEPPRDEPAPVAAAPAEPPSADASAAEPTDETPRRRVRGGRGRGRKADADTTDTAAADPSE